MALYKVKYRGLSDVRTISQKDLKDRNIGLSRDLEWKAENGWTQHVDGMTPELEKLLRDEGTFTLSEVSDKDQAEAVKIEASKSDDIASVVVDETTGQTSKKK